MQKRVEVRGLIDELKSVDSREVVNTFCYKKEYRQKPGLLMVNLIASECSLANVSASSTMQAR